MKIVLVTTAGDPLGGVFAKAYKNAGGPAIAAIIILPERRDCQYNFLEKPFVALKLISFQGIFRLLLAKRHLPLNKDRILGLDQVWPSSIGDANTKLLRWPSINNKSAMEKLRQIKPDVMISIGAPVIIKSHILQIPLIGAINVHNGLLPKYRGHFGTFWEIYHAEPWAYVIIHEMAEKVDYGTILAIERLEVKRFNSFFDILIEKKVVGGTLLAKLLKEIDHQGRVPIKTSYNFHESIASGYYGWPSWKDVMRLKWQS